MALTKSECSCSIQLMTLCSLHKGQKEAEGKKVDILRVAIISFKFGF